MTSPDGSDSDRIPQWLRNTRRQVLAGSAGTLGLASIGTASAKGDHDDDESGKRQSDHPDVREIISDWDKKQKKEAKKTIKKYGEPEGVTQRRLIWYDVGPWKRIEMFRDATPHDFPAPHPDFFEQVIDYGVPTTTADELTEYDGSVMIERTTGEMSARCHTEWANFLALNLAHDLITGEKSVKTARTTYAEIVEQKMAGKSPEYTEGLQFDTPQFKQRDPDITIIEDGTGGDE